MIRFEGITTPQTSTVQHKYTKCLLYQRHHKFMLLLGIGCRRIVNEKRELKQPRAWEVSLPKVERPG